MLAIHNALCRGSSSALELSHGLTFLAYNQNEQQADDSNSTCLTKTIFMSKNTIKLNSKNIIDIRKTLDTEINKAWKTIRQENVMSNKEIKAGLGSGKDLKSLYNSITQMAHKRIMIKGMLMYLNMGTTKFDFTEFKKTNNYHIFAACEAKEAIAQLKMIPTINPIEKAKKGKTGTGKKESFSSAKIAALLKNLQLEANKHDAELEKFNNETSIDIDNFTDDFKEYLAA